jgi:hypothetical protein
MRLRNDQCAAIRTAIELENGDRLVLVEVAEKSNVSPIEENRNIFRVNRNNDVLWQVSSTGAQFERDPFVSLTRAENGFIRGDRFFGNECAINVASGELEVVGWHK